MIFCTQSHSNTLHYSKYLIFHGLDLLIDDFMSFTRFDNSRTNSRVFTNLLGYIWSDCCIQNNVLHITIQPTNGIRISVIITQP